MGKLRIGRQSKKRRGLLPPEKIEDERFGWLLLWLMFVLFICGLSLVGNIINFGPHWQILKILSAMGATVGPGRHAISPMELPLSMLLNLLRILFAVLLLYRQKWGLYGIIGVHALSFIIEIVFGYFSFGSVIRLVALPGITFALARPVWKYLE